MLPATALGRIRFFCLGLAAASIVAPLPAALAAVDKPLWLRLSGAAAVAVVLAIWIVGYRRARFPLALEPVEVALVSLSSASVPPPFDIAPLFAVLFRSLYGPPGPAAARFGLYAAGVVVVTPELSVAAGRCLGLAMAAFGMQIVGRSLQRQEESEEGFRLLEGVKDYAVFMLTPDGDVRTWNTGAERMLGHTAESITGRPLSILYTAEDRERGAPERDLARASVEGGAEVEGWRLRADGSRFYAEVALTPLPARRGRPSGYTAIVRDITERRQAAIALAESEERLRVAVGGSPMVLWSVDRGGVVRLCEGGALEALGCDPAEVVGRRVEDAGFPRPRLAAETRRALDGEAALGMLEHEGHHFELRVSPVHDADGRPAGAIGVAIDVTAQQIAHRLQRTLLPSRLPEVPNVEMAARYRPGATGTEVGGDWYDAIPLPGGRVGLAVGDVVGRGAEAAALMGQLRNAVLIAALDLVEPSEVLERVNQLVPHLAAEKIATALYGVLDPYDGTFRFASAGHLPPLLLPAGGEPELLPLGGSLPLGALALTAYEDQTASVSPGSILLLYTDGLVEDPGTGLRVGLAELQRIAASAPREVDGLCDSILGSMKRASENVDDIALLAVRSVPVAADRIELELPARPDALTPLRDQVGRWLERLDADPRSAHRIKVALGEACANAVEHAYGPADATIRVTGVARDERVELAVRDSGRWRPPRSEGRGRGLPLMHALVEQVEISSEAAGTTVLLRHPLRNNGEPARPAPETPDG